MSSDMRRRVATFVTTSAALASVLSLTNVGPWWWAVGLAITTWHAYETVRGLQLDRRRQRRRPRPA